MLLELFWAKSHQHKGNSLLASMNKGLVHYNWNFFWQYTCKGKIPNGINSQFCLNA